MLRIVTREGVELNDSETEALRLAREAYAMAQAASSRIIGHEAVCTERWTQSRISLDELRFDVKKLLKGQDEQVGAIRFGKTLYAAFGAIAASAIWLATHFQWIK